MIISSVCLLPTTLPRCSDLELILRFFQLGCVFSLWRLTKSFYMCSVFLAVVFFSLFVFYLPIVWLEWEGGLSILAQSFILTRYSSFSQSIFVIQTSKRRLEKDLELPLGVLSE